MFSPTKQVSLREIRTIVKYWISNPSSSFYTTSDWKFLRLITVSKDSKPEKPPGFKRLAVEHVLLPLGLFIYFCLRSDLCESLRWRWTYSYSLSGRYYKCQKPLAQVGKQIIMAMKLHRTPPIAHSLCHRIPWDQMLLMVPQTTWRPHGFRNTALANILNWNTVLLQEFLGY